MYAPKFRSWLTDWERFDEALDAKLNEMADKAHAEIRAMVEESMPIQHHELDMTPAAVFNRLAALLQSQYRPSQEDFERQYIGSQNSAPNYYGLESIAHRNSGPLYSIFGP